MMRLQKREQATDLLQHREAAVPILNVGESNCFATCATQPTPRAFHP
jgi:hypothetical protein